MSKSGWNRPSKPPLEFLTLDYLKETVQDRALTLTVNQYKEALASDSPETGPNKSTTTNVAQVTHKGSKSSKKRSTSK